MDVQQWSSALKLEAEFIRRGEPISRHKLKDALQVSEQSARELLFALNNKDIIRKKADICSPLPGTTELILADIHFPFQDDAALEAALAFAEELQPGIITLLGDTVDFYKISRFVKNPTYSDPRAEIQTAREFLTNLRARFPKARIIFKLGNHEERLDAYLMSNAPSIYNLIDHLLQNQLHLPELNIEMKVEPFAIGKLWHLHGHEKPGGSYNPEYVCNVIWGYVHRSFIVGHFHRNQEKIYSAIDGDKYIGISLGYLAGQMDYALLNKWSQGVAVVRYFDGGRFKHDLKSVIDGEIY